MLKFFRGKESKLVEPVEIPTPKLLRGDVIQVVFPDGKDKNGNQKWKKRPVIVYKNNSKGADIVSVYCTGQNDPNDLTGSEHILVEYKSEEGISMGLTKDTYIRPNEIRHLPIETFVKPLGRCNLMVQIDKIRAIKASSGR